MTATRTDRLHYLRDSAEDSDEDFGDGCTREDALWACDEIERLRAALVEINAFLLPPPLYAMWAAGVSVKPFGTTLSPEHYEVAYRKVEALLSPE